MDVGLLFICLLVVGSGLFLLAGIGLLSAIGQIHLKKEAEQKKLSRQETPQKEEPCQQIQEKTDEAEQISPASTMVVTDYQIQGFDIGQVDLSEMDAVFEQWQESNGVSITDATIATLKKDIRMSYEFIQSKLSDHTRPPYDYKFLYFSEGSMGAEHSLGIFIEPEGCYLRQNDYDLKPPVRTMLLSSDHFIRDFLDFYRKHNPKSPDSDYANFQKRNNIVRVY